MKSDKLEKNNNNIEEKYIRWKDENMFNKIFLIVALIGVPLSVLGKHFIETIMFAVYCVTIIALAGFMGRATESLAIVSGPRIGGLLNATFGNAVELIISILHFKQG